MNLSSRPSEALRQALIDLEKVERDSRYVIDMGIWHQPRWDGKCHVCLAGAVMAQTLPPEQLMSSSKIDDMDLGHRLMGIDYFRSGDIDTGLKLFGHGCPSSLPPYVTVAKYFNDATMFKQDMRRIIDMLEGAGL